MTKTYLLLDAKNAAFRAYHTTGGLSHNDVATGVVFGMLREVKYLQERFGTNRIVFAFDWGVPLRKSVYRDYKIKRSKKNKTPKELKIYQEVNEQVRMIRTDYLPSAGFKNLFRQKGYEADDVIGSIIQSHKEIKIENRPKFIIVSSDKDFYQLLDWNVSVWHPSSKKLVTDKSFVQEWKLSPLQWVQLKSLAGCSSDDIPGVKGVGEKTAAQFLRGQLPETHKTHKAVMKWIKWDPNSPTTTPFRRNLKLVRLPYEGCNTFKLTKDGNTKQGVIELSDRLGMKSFLDGVSEIRNLGRCE